MWWRAESRDSTCCAAKGAKIFSKFFAVKGTDRPAIAGLSSRVRALLDRENDDRLGGQFHDQTITRDRGAGKGDGDQRVGSVEGVVRVHRRRGEDAAANARAAHAL